MSRDLRKFVLGLALILLTPAGFIVGLLWAMGDEPLGRCDRPAHHHHRDTIERIAPVKPMT